MKISNLREFVDDEMLRIAQDQIPDGQSREYYRGLSDAFSHSAKALSKCDKETFAALLAALLVLLEDKK